MSRPLLQRAATSLRLRAYDLRDRAIGRGDPLVPPRRLDFVGPSDFIATGDEFLGHFTALAGLLPTDRVLDVGCGIGRMARPLTRVLSPPGSYNGFDINAAGITWCRRRYAPWPNFRFVLADLHNRRYHPTGTQAAVEYRFPYDDDAFDLVVCTSVLTHLLEAETAQYVAEIARVLAPGGRALITAFLLDEGSRAALAAGAADLAFVDPAGRQAVVDPAMPEEAVAFDRAWMAATLQASGLEVAAVHEGAWRGAPGRSYQDLVLLRGV